MVICIVNVLVVLCNDGVCVGGVHVYDIVVVVECLNLWTFMYYNAWCLCLCVHVKLLCVLVL